MQTNTRFFVDDEGRFIGGFGDGAEPPEGAHEVMVAPPHGGAIWTGAEWMEPAPPPPALTPAQWGFFLDLSGFRDPLDAALDALPKTTMQERQTWAAMRAIAYNSAEYRLDVTLALVAQVRSMGLPVAIPPDDDIADAFTAATQFQGAASILGGA